MDNKLPCIFHYICSEHFSNYEWFEPYRTYRLNMSKLMYQPTSNAQPIVSLIKNKIN